MDKIEIFYSYSHKDEKLREELEKHLRILNRQGLTLEWHDRRISAGTEWEHDIDKHLDTAHIVLLLISPDFMASDYCNDVEVKRAMERHEAKTACVIPVVLRQVYWATAPFGKLQALPTDARAVTGPTWHNQDEAFFDVANGIRKVVEELRAQPSGSPAIAKQAVLGTGSSSVSSKTSGSTSSLEALNLTPGQPLLPSRRKDLLERHRRISEKIAYFEEEYDNASDAEVRRTLKIKIEKGKAELNEVEAELKAIQ